MECFHGAPQNGEADDLVGVSLTSALKVDLREKPKGKGPTPSEGAHQPSKLSVIMPVYNERGTIEEILYRVQAVEIEKEIIIVDDGSTDGTRQFLAELASCAQDDPYVMVLPASGRVLRTDNIRVLLQPENRGKGAALRRGFQEARGEIVIIQDADLELDPQDYYKLIEPIECGPAEVVYGSRFLGQPRQGALSYYAGNRFLTLSSNLCTGLNLTDVWIGYKVFRREILQKIELREDRFGFEPEITAKIARCGCRPHEVPVSYSCRTRVEGKKISWKDGFRGLWCTLRYSLFR